MEAEYTLAQNERVSRSKCKFYNNNANELFAMMLVLVE